MKLHLSLSKTIIIDLSDPDPQSLAAGWREQLLESLRNDDPEAQIDTCDIDTLTGAAIEVIDSDIAIAIEDLQIVLDDFKVVIEEVK